MLKVEPVDTVAYMYGYEYDNWLEMKKHYSSGFKSMLMHSKPVVKNNDFIRYRSNKGTRISFTICKKDCKIIADKYKDYYGKGPSGFIKIDEILAAILNKEDCYYSFIYDNSAGAVDLVDMNNNWSIDFDCTVYTIDTFTQIPLTKRTQEKINNANKIKSKANFHALVAKDVLVTKLNEHGFDIVVSDNRYLVYNKVKGWNKLAKEAIEYYLNNEVLKDIGCKIKTPKVKNQHKYGYNDYLCDLGEVELDLE